MITLVIVILALILGGALCLLGVIIDPILIGLGILVCIDLLVYAIIRLIKKAVKKYL